jgi:uncharacterized protein (TIGR03643 family)
LEMSLVGLRVPLWESQAHLRAHLQAHRWAQDMRCREYV